MKGVAHKRLRRQIVLIAAAIYQLISKINRAAFEADAMEVRISIATSRQLFTDINVRCDR